MLKQHNSGARAEPNPSSQHWDAEKTPVTTRHYNPEQKLRIWENSTLTDNSRGKRWARFSVNDSPPRDYNPEWLRGEERRGPREIYSSLSHLSLRRSDPWSDILKTTVSKPPTTNPPPQRTPRHLSPGKNTAQQSSFMQQVNKCHSRLGPAAVVFPFGQPSSIQEVVCNKRG